MNEHTPSAKLVKPYGHGLGGSDGPQRRPPTTAADGLPRRRFTADELRAMEQAGILGPEERVELIGGDIVVMSPKGRIHEILRSELVVFWLRNGPRNLKMATESPLRLSDDYEPVPDIIVYPANLVAPDVRPETVLLVVEVSDTTLAYDRKRKSVYYAAAGVREYWVINAQNRVTTVFRQPTAEGYASVTDIGPAERIAPEAAPELQVVLAALPEG
ncbi:MAG: Uma2 family endonuclease [Hyphomicrobiaceae bacterium]|nr:Uma2 family endonuclease [Hyphomicrobiaceae bacterium]